MTSALFGALFGLGLLLLAPRKFSGRSTVPSAGGWRLRSQRFRMVVIAAASGVTAGVLAWVSSSSVGLVVVAALSAVLIPGAIERARSATQSRLRARAWPDVVDRIVNRVRAGDTIVAALEDLRSFPVASIARGAAIFVDAVMTTSDVGRSLTLLRRTWNDAVGDRVAETLRLAHDIGGPGAVTALTTLSREVHRDLLVRSEVRARQAWIRVAMWVGVIAPWVVVVVLSTRPEGRVAFSSTIGGIVLVVGYALTLGAYVTMRRVARLQPEQRVFD